MAQENKWNTDGYLFFSVDYLPQNKLLIDIDIVKLKYIVKILRSYFLTKMKLKKFIKWF